MHALTEQLTRSLPIRPDTPQVLYAVRNLSAAQQKNSVPMFQGRERHNIYVHPRSQVATLAHTYVQMVRRRGPAAEAST
jgi:hypothetical protein